MRQQDRQAKEYGRVNKKMRNGVGKNREEKTYKKLYSLILRIWA